MQVITRQMGGLGGKQGGLQDMIKDATAENIPGPDWVLNRAIVEYINRSPNRGSEKAFKYMKARFTQSHVKVQNLTLLVLETCMKNCGHMFREKLPFSELWEELHKVAILKRKADTQIYNKVLSLIEDWSDAISLPAYRQEFTALKTGAARFPVRQERDLSGYVPDGHHGGIPTQLVIPPGTSDEDRAAIEQAQAELNGARPGIITQGSPSAKNAAYTYGGDGHFAAPPQAPGGVRSSNVAELPANHLAPGQKASKLKEDLFSTANSVELFNEMLAPIKASSAADVKQEFVAEQAEQCAEMMKRLGVLAEVETDEATLQQTLELHSAVEAAMERYTALLEVADGRAPPESALQEETASVSAPPSTRAAPSRVAPKPSLNLLDFYDDVAPVPTPAAVNGGAPAVTIDANAPPQTASAAPVPAAPASTAPAQQRSLVDDILGDLYAPVPVIAAAGPGVAAPASSWAGMKSQKQSNNPFAAADVPAPLDAFADPGKGEDGFGTPAFGAQAGRVGAVAAPPPHVSSPVSQTPRHAYNALSPGASGGLSVNQPQGPYQNKQQQGAAQEIQHYGNQSFGQPAFGQQAQYPQQPQYGQGYGQQGNLQPQQQGNYPPQQQGNYPPQQQGNYQQQQQGSYQQLQQGNYPPQQQGFYGMSMAQPQGLGYAPQPQAPSEDMFGDTAFGAQQQPAEGRFAADPWGHAPAFGQPSPSTAQAGSGSPWGMPAAGTRSTGAAPPVAADPFGDLVSLRK